MSREDARLHEILIYRDSRRDLCKQKTQEKGLSSYDGDLRREERLQELPEHRETECASIEQDNVVLNRSTSKNVYDKNKLRQDTRGHQKRWKDARSSTSTGQPMEKKTPKNCTDSRQSNSGI
eukprot:1492873-Amphidinium_carterae.1